MRNEELSDSNIRPCLCKITRVNAAGLTILLLFLYRTATRNFSSTPRPSTAVS